MTLAKWSRDDLAVWAKNEGYNIVKCDNEEHALDVKSTLKQLKRCAQAGYVLNKDKEKVYFVITKERGKSDTSSNSNNG